jgi:FkbM family methyltransferase
MYGTYIGNNRMFVTLQVGGRIYTLADDLSLTPDLVQLGFYEAGLTNYVMQNIQAGMNVVDVGANIGYFSVLLGFKVGPQGKITAYEPNSAVRQLLLDNLAINGHTKFSTVSRKGVYSKEAKLRFHISDRFQGNSSIKQHSDQYKSDFISDTQSFLTINTVALDNEDLGYIDFLKIDTEGGEYHVFLGMKEMLKNKQVGTVVFELNKSMLQDDTENFYHFLKALQGRYVYYLLNPNGETVAVHIDEIFKHDFIDNIVMKKV